MKIVWLMEDLFILNQKIYKFLQIYNKLLYLEFILE